MTLIRTYNDLWHGAIRSHRPHPTAAAVGALAADPKDSGMPGRASPESAPQRTDGVCNWLDGPTH